MTGQKYSCQGCTRDDLTLTRNGKVRSHAPDGKRVGPDNPACGMGSEYPLESTEFHTHRFEYGDDGHGHSGSFCVVDHCGLAEMEETEPPAAPVPPNPFRDPLPGGVWDSKAPAPVVQRPVGPTSADDFLDGSDDDLSDAGEADDGRRYFPSRYDGTCVTCLDHFSEGDMITRGPDDDGWEAQDCCGENAVQRPERPKAVARTLPVVRGRYSLPHPETGKKITGQRASSFAEGIADSYALDQWRHRMILVGLVQDSGILDKVSTCLRNKDPLETVKREREFLNKRAEEAMTAAGGSIRSGKGTTLHKYTEELDGGTRALADVPEEYRKDARAYLIALEQCGFRPVKGLIERSAYSDELKVCGTFDRVLECIRDTNTVDLDGRPVQIKSGEFVIGDVKSGDNIESPWLEILIQEAIYAHAVNENGIAVQDTPGGPFRWVSLAEMGAAPVREDVGIVMHVPYGQGEAKLYYADLITGWRGAKICQQNRDFWKIKLPKQPVAEFAVGEVPADDPGLLAAVRAEASKPEETEPPAKNIMEAVRNATAALKAVSEPEPQDDAYWQRRFRAVRTKEAANDLWREAKAAGVDAMDLRIMVSLVQIDKTDQEQTAVSRPPESSPAQVVAESPDRPQTAAGGQDGPPLTLRAHQVTTKAEASKIFREINDKINDMPEDKRAAAREYRDKLVKIMQDLLKAA